MVLISAGIGWALAAGVVNPAAADSASYGSSDVVSSDHGKSDQDHGKSDDDHGKPGKDDSPVDDEPADDSPVYDEPADDSAGHYPPVLDSSAGDPPAVFPGVGADEPVEVAGVVAVAPQAGSAVVTHPLPTSAAAGEASTDGQVVAAGLAAMAGFCTLAAAFVLRRRHGDS